jgi:hypothetical protein
VNHTAIICIALLIFLPSLRMPHGSALLAFYRAHRVGAYRPSLVLNLYYLPVGLA